MEAVREWEWSRRREGVLDVVDKLGLEQATRHTNNGTLTMAYVLRYGAGGTPVVLCCQRNHNEYCMIVCKLVHVYGSRPQVYISQMSHATQTLLVRTCEIDTTSLPLPARGCNENAILQHHLLGWTSFMQLLAPTDDGHSHFQHRGAECLEYVTTYFTI